MPDSNSGGKQRRGGKPPRNKERTVTAAAADADTTAATSLGGSTTATASSHNLPLEINPPPQSGPLSPTLSQTPPYAYATYANFERAAISIGVIVVSWVVLSTPEARRKVLKLLCAPRWIVRSVSGRRKGGGGEAEHSEQYDFYYDRRDLERRRANDRMNRSRSTGAGLGGSGGGENGNNDTAVSRVHLTRQSPPTRSKNLVSFGRHPHSPSQRLAAPQRPPPSFLPSPVDETRIGGSRHSSHASSTTIWPSGNRGGSATSLCTGLILPEYDGDGNDVEETDHDRFVRDWPQIRTCPYGRLVLPPDCRRVDPTKEGGKEGKKDSKGKDGGKDMTKGGGSGGGEANDDAAAAESGMGFCWSSTQFVNLLRRVWLRVKSVVTFDYVGLTVKFYMRVIDALRYRRDKRLGRPTGEEEEEADDDDDDDDDDGDDEGSLTSLTSVGSKSSLMSLVSWSSTRGHKRRGSRDAVGTVAVPAGAGDASAAAPGKNRDRFYSVLSVDPTGAEEKKDAAESGSGGPAAAAELAAAAVAAKDGIDWSTATPVVGSSDGGGSGGGEFWSTPERIPASASASASSPKKAVPQDGIVVETVAEGKRPPSPSNRFFLIPPRGGGGMNKVVPVDHESALGGSGGIIGGGGKRRDALEAYRSQSMPKQQAGFGSVSAAAPPPALSASWSADQAAPPPLDPPRSPDAAATPAKSVVSLSPRTLRHSSSTPVLSNAGGVHGSPGYSPTKDQQLSNSHSLSSISSSQHPPLAFFDTAESNATLKKLARDVPIGLPDKNGYILSDETLPDSRCTPLLVFVNTRSGPQQGQVIVTQLRRLLNPIQIWDLADGGPEMVLESFVVLSRLRILVCGGDGTVSWIISALERMDLQRRWPPIAILPLGTGNDLARIHGWGGGYGNESILLILEQITDAYVSLLDRWQMTIEDKKGRVKDTKDFTNYLGVGVDAQTALGVHLLRESAPEFFFSRAVNKAWYFVSGAEENIKASCAGLPNQLTLIADGVEIPLPPDSQGIIFLNIDSYAGGVPLWSDGVRPRKLRSRRYSEGDYLDKRRRASSIDGHDSNDEFDSEEIVRELDYEEKLAKITACGMPSSCQDGMLDVVSIRSIFHLGQIKTGLSNAQLVCQCKEATIKLTKKVAVQIDGEPWRQNACKIRVTRKKDPAIMLHRAAAEGGGVETEMAKLLDWAEERQVIDRNVHATLMREFSRRIESKTRQRRVDSQDNLFFAVKRAVGASSSPSF